MLFIIYQKTVDFCQKKNQALSESEYNDGKYFLYYKIDIKQFKIWKKCEIYHDM